MNIGIDLDGVLFDTEAMLKCRADLYDLSINGKGVINKEEQLCQHRYDWTVEQEREFLYTYLIPAIKTAPLKYCAREVLNELKKQGHKLYIITSRGNVLDEEVTATKQRFKKEKLKFDDVAFYASNKVEYCKKFNIDVMIDDYAVNVESLAKNGIKCLYFRELVLKFLNHKNIIEVNSWGEVLRQINILNKKIKKTV